MQSALPPGIVSGNGRLEAQLVDASAKEPLRVKEVLVKEGDLVKPGQVVGRLDTVTLEADLAKDRASVAAAREEVAAANSAIIRQKSEIRLAQIELDRSKRLLAEKATSERRIRGSQDRTRNDDGQPGAIRGERAISPATDRRRPGQRGKDRESNQGCDAGLDCNRPRVVSPHGTGRGSRTRRQGADTREPGRRLHGDLPAGRTGGSAQGWCGGANHPRLSTERRRPCARQLRVA